MFKEEIMKKTKQQSKKLTRKMTFWIVGGIVVAAIIATIFALFIGKNPTGAMFNLKANYMFRDGDHDNNGTTVINVTLPETVKKYAK